MANKYTFGMFIAEFIKYAKAIIIDLENNEDLKGKGKEKKKQLDKAIVGWLTPLLVTIKFSIPFVPDWFVKFLFNKFILGNVPVFTQAVFDLLESKIKGITK